jgi:hypothetical protein
MIAPYLGAVACLGSLLVAAWGQGRSAAAAPVNEAGAELEAADRSLLRRAGFRASRQLPPVWPTFPSHRPGCPPWFLDEVEAQLLLADLAKVTALARLCGEHPELFDGARPRNCRSTRAIRALRDP